MGRCAAGITPQLVAALLLLSPAGAAAQTPEDWPNADISRFWTTPEVTRAASHVSSTATGDATVVLPLELPVSRLTPELAMRYRAQGRDDRELGLGWSLGLSAIRRDTARGVPQYTELDTFESEIGRLARVDPYVSLPFPSVHYRLESDQAGQRRSYVYQTTADTWTVTDKSGEVATYAPLLTGRGGTFEWALVSRVNAFGDEVTYTYGLDDGVLETIRYGGNVETGDEAEYLVTFVASDRSCTRTDYRAGTAVRHDARVEQIKVYRGDTLLRSILLSYAGGCPDRLESVTIAGVATDGTTTTETPWSFEYHDDAGFERVSWPSDVIAVDQVSATYDWELQNADGDSETGGVREAVRTIAAASANGDPLGDVLGTREVLGGQLVERAGYDPGSHAMRPVGGVHPVSLDALERETGGRILVRTGSRDERYFVRDEPRALADVDGDGFDDIVTIEAQGWRIAWGSSAGLGAQSTLVPAPAGGATRIGRTLRRHHGNDDVTLQTAGLYDLNGDGALDYVYFDVPISDVDPGVGAPLNVVYWDRSARRWSATPRILRVPWCYSECALRVAYSREDRSERVTVETARVQFQDLNGDGLLDLVRDDGGEWFVYWGRGEGWEPEQLYGYASDMHRHIFGSSVVGARPGFDDFCTESMTADLNGDGLPDNVDVSLKRWYRNTGAGFVAQPLEGAETLSCLLSGSTRAEAEPDELLVDSCPDYGGCAEDCYDVERCLDECWELLDDCSFDCFEGCYDECDDTDDCEQCLDTCDDECELGSESCTDECLDGGDSCLDDCVADEEDCVYHYYPAPGELRVDVKTTSTARDWNGDGGVDVLDTAAQQAWIARYPAGYQLSAIDTQAGRTEVTWRASGELYPSGDWTEEHRLPSAIDTLAGVAQFDRVTGEQWETSYLFAFGAIDVDSRRFLGFAHERRDEPLNRRSTFERHVEPPFTGLTSRETHGEGPSLRLELEHAYDVLTPDGWYYGASVVVSAKTDLVEHAMPGGPRHPRRSGVEREYDAQGNVTLMRVLGPNSSSEQDDLEAGFAWAVGANGRTVACELSVWGYDDHEEQTRLLEHTRYLYDDLRTDCVAERGALTTVVEDRFGQGIADEELLWRLTRNEYGQLVEKISPAGAITHYLMDLSSRYVAATSDAVGIVRREVRDDWDHLVSSTAPSGRVTEYVYDGFGRVLEVWDGSDQVGLRRTTSFAHHSGAEPYLVESKWTAGGLAASRRTWYDAWRRPVQERSWLGGEHYLVRDYAYNPDGSLAATGRPFEDTDDLYEGWEADQAITHTYHALGRWRSTEDYAGGVKRELGLASWISDVEDASGYRVHRSVGAGGRVVRHSAEEGGVELPPATYGWDVLGRLLWVVDPDGVRTDLYWASTGELLRIESPDIGWREFDYDADGYLIGTRDSAGRVVSTSRDGIGRPLLVAHDGISRETYEWDTIVPGELSRVVYAGGFAGTTYDYDSLGRLASVRVGYKDGKLARSSFEYDELDRLVETALPDGARVHREYVAGRPSRLMATLSDDTQAHLATFAYDASGELAGWTSPGASLALERDPISARLSAARWSYPGGNVDYEYGWYDNGLLAWRKVRGETTAFGYDPAQRLVGAVGSQPATFTLSPGGDVLQQRRGPVTSTLDTLPGSHHIDAVVTPAGRHEYFYDDAGAVSMISPDDGSAPVSIEHDAAGRVTAVSGPTGAGYFRHYDHEGTPFFETIDGSVVRRLGEWEQVTREGAGRFPVDEDVSTIRHAGLVVARIIDGRRVRGVITDLQHASVVEVEGGGVARELDTDLFGLELSRSGETDNLHHWLDKPRSKALGVVGMDARLVRPDTTSFLSVDPFLLGPGFVQAAAEPYRMHPYRYAAGDPGRFEDRQGDFGELIALYAASYTDRHRLPPPTTMDQVLLAAFLDRTEAISAPANAPGLGDRPERSSGVSETIETAGFVLVVGGLSASGRVAAELITLEDTGVALGSQSSARYLGSAAGGSPSLRSFTARNFRENLGRLTGGLPQGAQAHHVLPVKFEAQFGRVGINIHDPRFGTWWEAGAHARASTAYNRAWSEFFATTRNPTAEEILEFGRNLAGEYGLTIGF